MSQFSLRPSSVIGMPIVAMKFRGIPCSGGAKKPGCETRGQTMPWRAASCGDGGNAGRGGRAQRIHRCFDPAARVRHAGFR